MCKPQEGQDLLSTCLHPFFGAGITVHLCCRVVAGMHCSKLSSSFCLLIGEQTVASESSLLLLFSLGQKLGAVVLHVDKHKSEKGVFKTY